LKLALRLHGDSFPSSGKKQARKLPGSGQGRQWQIHRNVRSRQQKMKLLLGDIRQQWRSELSRRAFHGEEFVLQPRPWTKGVNVLIE
jgi:hypothetical protein